MSNFKERVSDYPNRRRITFCDSQGNETRYADIEHCEREGVKEPGTELSADKLNMLLSVAPQDFSDSQKEQARKNLSIYSATQAGIKGQVLKSNGDSMPFWADDTGTRPTTLVVGFSDGCDYNITKLQTEDAAETAINAAIAALPEGGGKIILHDGVYNIKNNPVLINKANVTLEGMGSSTILRRMGSFDDAVICMSQNYCKVSNLYVDGNSKNYAPEAHGILSQGDNNTITETVCKNNGGGVYASGFENIVKDNRCSENSLFGMAFASMVQGMTYHTIKGNICVNNGSGIYVSNSNNVIMGNVCHENADSGLLIFGCTNIISGNMCYKNAKGMLVMEMGSVGGIGNNITGNMCAENSEVGISLTGFHNFVNSNQIFNNCVTVDEDGNINEGNNIEDNGRNNVIEHNKIDSVFIRSM